MCVVCVRREERRKRREEREDRREERGERREERDSGDRARLVVQRLRQDDQGRYECYTPSTDTRYQGNYSASVVVKGGTKFSLQILH